MNRPSLKKLTIEYLRGSIAPFPLVFDKGKRLTVVYGENGTGKSTLCDAFEFLAKGQVGSLDNRGLGRTIKYWHSVGKSPADVSVTLETTAGVCTAKILRSQVVAVPPENRPLVEMLRRNQILALIQAPAADRYNAISRFIDVTSIESSENTLREAIRASTASRDGALLSVNNSRTTIDQFWETEGKLGKTALDWAKSQSNSDGSQWDQEVTDIKELQRKYDLLVGYPQQLTDATNSLNKAQENLKSAQSTMLQAVKATVPEATETMALLKAAQGYLNKHPKPEECPLCGSKEKIAGLIDRISAKMNTFCAVNTAQTQVTVNEQPVLRAQQQIELVNQNALNAAKSFCEFVESKKWPNDVQLPANSIPAQIDKWREWFEANLLLGKNWTDATTKRIDRKQFLGTLKKAYNTCVDNTKTADELTTLVPQLERTLKIVEEERHKFTKGMLATIATEVGRLYEKVHPGEGLNKISLTLDPNRRASLDIGADIYGQTDMPPQAYFSDSHLDTLGLCVFLALAAMEKPTEKVLILDDVLGSIDEPHVERLIEMLYEEGLEFQHCLITTHYRPWKEKLRWGWLKSGQCQFLELSKWSLEKGLASTRSIPDIQRLGELLDEPVPDAQLICSKAGVILEAILNFLSQLYECSVPHRSNNRFTLGELLPAIDKKLRNALKIEIAKKTDEDTETTYEAIALAPYFDELQRIAQARNIFGCHFNELCFELLEADAIYFGQQVLDLSKLLVDADAGWPRNKKSGSYWATSGETRRLHPLLKPM